MNKTTLNAQTDYLKDRLNSAEILCKVDDCYVQRMSCGH